MGSTHSSSKPSTGSLQIRNHQLFVNGKPFFVKGVCYAPVPIGESSNFVPHGDYFGVDHAYLWRRDLPLIQQLGANVIRVYAWQPDVDHMPFLDAVASAKLKVLISFELGAASTSMNPVSTSAARSLIIQRFVKEVAKYATHEAVLAWSFGNELNGPWNNYLQSMTHLDNEAMPCNWSEQCSENIDVNSWCHAAATCAYTTLFSFINEAARSAKQAARDTISASSSPSSRYHHRKSPPLIVSGLADVDHLVGISPLIDKVTRFQYLLTDMDAWAVQLYRGRSFGDFFHQFATATASALVGHTSNNVIGDIKNTNSSDDDNGEKPLMVTEFGVDAFNDMCGWPENIKLPVCFNLPGDSLGGDEGPSSEHPFVGCSDPSLECAQPGVVTQSKWDLQLAHELMLNSRWFAAQSVAFQHRKNQIVANGIASSISAATFSSSGSSTNAVAAPAQVVLGGFVMAWSDEYWKGSQSMNGCVHPCPSSDLQACRSEPQIAAFNRTDGPAQCRWKSHFSCPNWNASYHDVCGYFLPGGAPDNYVNDEWFGITTPTDCQTLSGGTDYHDKYGGHRLNSLTLRPSYFALRRLWRDDDVQSDAVSVASCESLTACWKCVVGSEVTTGGDAGSAADMAAQKKVADKCRRVCAIGSIGEESALVDRHSLSTNDNQLDYMSDMDADNYSFMQPFIIFMLVVFVLVDLCYLRRQRRAKANDESTPLLPTTSATSTPAYSA